MRVLLLKGVPMNGMFHPRKTKINVPDEMGAKLIRNKVAVKVGDEVPVDEDVSLEEMITSVHASGNIDDTSLDSVNNPPRGGTTLESMTAYLVEREVEIPTKPKPKEADLRQLIDSLPEDDDEGLLD